MFLVFLKRWFFQQGRPSIRIARALLFATLLNLVFGGLFFLTERAANPDLTLIDSIWWAMVTMTTVGYGDYFPTTTIGRFLVGYPTFLFGIGLIGYLLGVITEAVLERISRKRKGLLMCKQKNHFVICNCPSPEKIFELADEIRARPDHAEAGIVVIDDEMEEAPEEFSLRRIEFVRGSPLSEECLRRAQVLESYGVIVLARRPGDHKCDAETYATGSILEQIEVDTGRPIRTVVELVSARNARMMARAKTDGTVLSEGVSDHLLVQEILSPGTNQVFTQLFTTREGCELYTVETTLTDSSIVELQVATLRHPANLQVLGVLRDNRPILNAAPGEKLLPGDRLVVLGDDPGGFARIENELRATLAPAG